MVKRVGDLTNHRFGKLTVLSLDSIDKYYSKRWKCLCDCGNIAIVSQGHLRSGHTTSCGCNKNLLDDLTGMTFGYLTVIERADDYITPLNGKVYVQWLCKCICGKETIVTSSNLKSGSTVSCGCKNPKKLKDLTGQQFGGLTVVKRVKSYVNPSGRKLVRYLCKCSCGQYIYALANTLRVWDVTSCGCKVNSKGELIVKSFLDENNIRYETHKSFEDCLSDKGFRLNFDFYVEDYNLLIECDGIQHYEPIEFFGGNTRYVEQKRNDFLKHEYAMNNDYDYLVIDCRKQKLKKIKGILLKHFN